MNVFSVFEMAIFVQIASFKDIGTLQAHFPLLKIDSLRHIAPFEATKQGCVGKIQITAERKVCVGKTAWRPEVPE